jgi:hypothetical protein
VTIRIVCNVHTSRREFDQAMECFGRQEIICREIGSNHSEP